MSRRKPAPLAWLGGLLALYLCAPLVAAIPQILAVEWTSVDWHALGQAAGISAGSATAATLVIALGGVPLGYWLARRPGPFAALVGFLAQLPLALPPLTSGILLLFLLGPYSPLGTLTNGALTDSFTGILLASVFVAAPFLIVAARSAFHGVDPMLEDVAATLGHRPHARFFRVALPLAWPAIRAGLLLSWLRAFGEFGATVMVAYHPYSLPVYTYVAFGSQGLPAMMPIVLPTLGIALIASLLAALSTRRAWRHRSPPVERQEPTGRHGAYPSGSIGLAAATGTSAAGNRPAVPHPDDAAHHSVPALSFAFQKRVGQFQLDVRWAPRARRLAILGESGSGKSMTLRLIAGLERADQAMLQFGVDDYSKLLSERRHFAYVPQDYGLFPHLSVERQWSFARDARPEVAAAWAQHLGLDGLMRRYPAQLSIGQRQRVSIVRALARPCRLILLDEPFSALDTPRRRQLQESLRQLQQEITATTILVTHDPDEAARLADEMLVIDHGRVLQQGPTREVFRRPAGLKVAELLGLSNVGAGRIDVQGRLDIGGDVALDLASRMVPGTKVMWRIDPDAVRRVLDTGHPSTIDDVLLVDGRLHAVARLGDARLRLRARRENWQTRESAQAGGSQRLSIDPEGIDVWPLVEDRLAEMPVGR